MQRESLRGLTSAEVADRVATGRANDVPSAPTRTVTQIVRANLLTRFNALLGAMLVVILVVGQFRDVLFGVVLIANTLIGIVQELRAKRTLDRLSVLTAPKARIVRDDTEREVSVAQVVLDDVLELSPGDQVVVDGEVLESSGLEVDESLVTGESDAASKSPGDEVLSGSFVAAGSGRYRATRVGRAAYAVRLAEDARRFTLTRSELRAAIDRILTLVTYAIVPTAVLLFASQLFRAHESVRGALAAAVAGTVAMVPEGLVLLTSVAFAVGVVRLARRRVLAQELSAVEGLARVDVLCIDKTGTLTEGRLAVEEIEALDAAAPHDAALAGLAAADPNPNATMTAIAERFPRPDEEWRAGERVPFSSARKWSAAAFDSHGTWVLGAPDVVLPADDPLRARAEGEAALGRRVLLLERTDAAITNETLPTSLEPIALISLGDRPRQDAAKTLAYFREQGVAVKVISGDHPATVGAIARRLGAEGAEDAVDAKLLPGDPGDPGELADVMERSSVFGRVTPQQKREMVKALQSRGHVVAMTGDGVNDVLALKEADIGVAMGSGAAATRAVAQLVLLDSTFDALPPVVAEGRRVLGNIERTSGLYLTKTVYAMLLALAVGVAGLAFPFLPRHLTLIGSVTIGIPSFFLALGPNTERARPGFLRRVARFAVPAGTLAAVATFLAYQVAGEEPGITLGQQRTAATMVLTWIGLLVLSIIAAPLTRARLVLVWSMAGLFLTVMLTPPTRDFFALHPPDDLVWLASFGVAAIVWSFARLFVPGDRPVGPQATE